MKVTVNWEQRMTFEADTESGHKVKMDAGKLSMDDILTSLLSVMHASNAAIAACLGVSAGAVRSRKTRLKGKLSDEMYKFVFG